MAECLKRSQTIKGIPDGNSLAELTSFCIRKWLAPPGGFFPPLKPKFH